ncbi:hypothetical protein BJX63DRAFT_287682 [Aspergillus granulosus]|uniref:Uncharacterized protein n=1 Tax=Aspergillus granulosus TaxID=176169 RepID=A0ABR4H6U4_9EURO
MVSIATAWSDSYNLFLDTLCSLLLSTSLSRILTQGICDECNKAFPFAMGVFCVPFVGVSGELICCFRGHIGGSIDDSNSYIACISPHFFRLYFLEAVCFLFCMTLTNMDQGGYDQAGLRMSNVCYLDY